MTSRYDLSPVVQKRLKDLNLTAEDVIRKALNLTEGFTTSDGTHFPEQTVFLAWYKDRACSAIVKDGALTIEGKRFTSLSAAAAHYTGRATTNGWGFWSVKYPGKQDFVLASTLGPKAEPKTPKAKAAA